MDHDAVFSRDFTPSYSLNCPLGDFAYPPPLPYRVIVFSVILRRSPPWFLANGVNLSQTMTDGPTIGLLRL